MAKQNFQNTSSTKTNVPFKGMVKDFYDSYYPEGCWSHAVNASNYSKEGDIGTLSNENGNQFCAAAPYNVIGRIYLFDQKWIIFSTDDQDHHEIGLFDEAVCSYYGIVRDRCLGFSQLNLVTGVSKKNFDCTWQIYFADGNNPDRSMNIGNPETWGSPAQPPITDTNLGYNWPGVPYVQDCTIVPGSDPASGIGCEICTDTPDLDCNKIRLSRLINSPCAKISKGLAGGSMPNGSYYVVIAYSINQQRVTDYFTPSNVQAIFSHQNVAGSLDITFENLDTQFFEEFELVVVSTISQQTVAKQIGFYSTNIGSISLDSIDLTTPSIPLEQIPQRSPVYATSDKISQVSDYMLRISPKTRFDFNYQPLANRIQAKWVAVEYPTNYYRNGGSNTSYLRDEVYAFWIRWVYETGEKSASYHIPGRPPEREVVSNCIPTGYGDLSPYTALADNIERYELDPSHTYTPHFFEVYNTGYVTDPALNIPLEDGGIIRAKGKMGYWQSTEVYPNKPDIWNTSVHDWSNINCTKEPEVDLCGEYIRHHKMPDNKCVPHIKSYDNNLGPGIYPDTEKIILLGVEFENIHYPVDNDGVGIPGIIGYEILRGSREGNKSIIAKGIFNNLREHDIDNNPYGSPPPTNGRKGLYQNYPYNPLGIDPSLTAFEVYPGSDNNTHLPDIKIENDTMLHGFLDPGRLHRVKTDMYTFHSPDTQFREPFLGETEVKLYGEVFGDVFGNFDTVPDHPKHKVISDATLFAAMFGGVGIAAIALMGKRTLRRTSGYAFNLGNIDMGNVSYTNPTQTWDLFLAGTSGGALTGSITQTNSQFSGSAQVPEDNGTLQEQLTDENSTGTTQFISDELNMLLNNLNTPNTPYSTVQTDYKDNADGKKGYIGPGYSIDVDSSAYQFAAGSPVLGALGSLAKFTYYWVEGTDSILKLIEALITYEQYALMYTSHGNYSVFDPGLVCAPGQQRRLISSLFYLDNNIQNMVRALSNEKYIINNLYRNKCVVVELSKPILPLGNIFQGAGHINTIHNTTGTCIYPASVPQIHADNTVQVLNTVTGNNINAPYQDPADTMGAPGTATFWYDNPTRQFRTNAVSPYGALKYRIRNQYGQLELVRQIPASKCVISINPLSQTDLQRLCKFPKKYDSGLIFGGDTYIGRYTEKNKFFYFSEWLNKLPDGTPLDYTLHYMIKYAKYWGDFTGFDLSTFINNLVSGGIWVPGSQTLPNDFHNFDRATPNQGLFNVMKGYFYLFQCGVRDFFVESEINVDLRDWGNEPFERFYDPYKYTDLKQLFHPNIIKYDNYYKYDFSLSVSRIYNNFISWGQMHPRYYDPNVAELCYQYYPNRVLYSLPANLESIKDNWYAFLANNYKDFTSKITAIKNIGKNGAAIFFKNQAPAMFQGVDTLETDLGTKVTIGDGGLFSQPMQYLSNADMSFEYGACEDSLSVVNTPVGIFYMSTVQGKVFKTDGTGLIPISDQYMKWWFATFLPYFLLQDFPNFAVVDNPVAGIGCQAIYDNTVGQLYFCKRDFRLRKDLAPGTTVTYGGEGNRFLVNNSLKIDLGDPAYFEDASWTISYDPDANDGAGGWISFHDWHPNLHIPARSYFLTILNNIPWLSPNDIRQHGFWKHNFDTSLFTNYYDRNFRYEIEWAMETDTVVNTLRNVMYQMECFIYDNNIQYDRYNVLDYNFDHAIVYNIEQVSGVLNLNLAPKNDVVARAQYPIVNPTSIDILFTKEEQKYRFNTFWDITDDRGEYTFPTVQRRIFDTAANGYDMILNPNNLNYAKDPFQHKKFRHYTNFVKLYTKVDQTRKQNVNMLFKIINDNNLYSPR
jgi:hypothetical protein